MSETENTDIDQEEETRERKGIRHRVLAERTRRTAEVAADRSAAREQSDRRAALQAAVESLGYSASVPDIIERAESLLNWLKKD